MPYLIWDIKYKDSSGEVEAGISLEFEPSLVYMEFQASQGYILERPCLKGKKAH